MYVIVADYRSTESEKTGNDAEHVFHLLVRPKDPTSELWEGPRSGIQAAQDVFNADEVGKHISNCIYAALR